MLHTQTKPAAYLESGFEVSKILAHSGIKMNAPAITVRWGQIAEIVGDVFADAGLPIDRLDPRVIIDLVGDIQQLLLTRDVLQMVREYTRQTPTFLQLAAYDFFVSNQEEPEEEGMAADEALGNDVPMDGDDASALASAGMGSDEDYFLFEADPYDR